MSLAYTYLSTVLCYYGVGKPTERAYIYKTIGEDPVSTGAHPRKRETYGKVLVTVRRGCCGLQVLDGIDTALKDPARNISDGVFMGEGDGTVTLMSLGYHCAHVSEARATTLPSILETLRRGEV